MQTNNKNATGNVNGSLAIQRKMKSHNCAIGNPISADKMQHSGWSAGGGVFKNATGSPKKMVLGKHVNMAGASKDYNHFKVPSKGDWSNASGSVGAIVWNATGGDSGTGAYEDKSGHVYTDNGDGTFDDGSGTNFNADGSLATSGGSSFFGELLTTAEKLAPTLITSKATQSANATKAAITQSNNNAAVANSWVMPTLVVGGLIAAGFAYWLTTRKK
jgi:hypothetical protein